MSKLDDSTFHGLPEEQMLLVNRLCNQFEAKWKHGEPALVEEVLIGIARENWPAALSELLPLEIEYRWRTGTPLRIEDYLRRFPDLDSEWLSELLSTTRIHDELASEDAADAPAKLGDYRILTRIGGGGMGTVYKAIHERMGRFVALKVLRSEMQRDPMFLKRFDREVRTAARLSHPNVVAALDAREQDGIHFLITEFVEGIDLDALVRADGPLSVAAAVDCILQAARGLDYAHRQGVVHRDIKPANLLRDTHGVVKVLDMGLARLDSPDDPTATDLTQTGMVMGTAAYMAPEQARDTRRADARSDIYSLGCTFYFLLNGRSMFAGESVIDTILSHVNQPIPTLTRNNTPLPAMMDGVFRRMVAKDPDDRFQTAAELVTALEALQAEVQPDRLGDDASYRSLAPAFGSGDHTVLTEGTLPTVGATVLSNPVARAYSRSQHRRAILIGGIASLIIAGLGIYAAMNLGGKGEPTTDRYALRFDGRTSYVEVPALIPIKGETYTLEAIVRPRNFRTSNIISWLGPDWMALFIEDDARWGVARRVGNESFLFHSNDRAVLGETVHVAGVYRGSDLSLFINGRRVEPVRFPFDLPETRDDGLFIGGVPPDLLPEGQNDRFFDGEIDAARISKGQRYTRSFQPPASLTSDPDTIALFPFEEGRGLKTSGAGERGWEARIIHAEWQSVP